MRTGWCDVQSHYGAQGDKSAIISVCGRFRYRLARYWPSAEPRRPLLFVMLNPSTADAFVDDPTIRKCMGFAQRLGFNGIEVVNLFAYRATAPKDLKRCGWLQGDFNLYHVLAAAAETREAGGAICAAWGAHARGRWEAGAMLASLRREGHAVHALRLTADGIPWHPLMLPYNCTLMDMPA